MALEISGDQRLSGVQLSVQAEGTDKEQAEQRSSQMIIKEQVLSPMEAGVSGRGCLLLAPTGLRFPGNQVGSRISGLGLQPPDGLWLAAPLGFGTTDL